MSLAAPLISYLRQLERKGETHVHLDERSKIILREFYKKAKGITTPAQPAQRVSSQPAAQQATPIKISQNTPVASPTQQTPVIAAKAVGNSAEEKMASLRNQAEAHRLPSLRHSLVFSTGKLDADLMIIGDAAGYHEEKQGQPFAGPAGQKLDAILKAMGLQREQVYISNIVKFRPAQPNQTTNTRKPTLNEMAHFRSILQEEITVVRPKVIIALGDSATSGLLGTPSQVSRLRGSFQTFVDTPLRATFHPREMLHKEATPEKRLLWEDMLAVMELLNLPISEKQRRFFLPK